MEKQLTLKSGLKLIYASDKLISQQLEAKHLDEAKRLNSNSDLESGIYEAMDEGGLKIWECAVDLCNFLDQTPMDISRLDVLELGCGAGLPSIVALKKGARSVTLQDFNDFVIETFTRKNFELNGVPLDSNKCKFYAGNWDQELVEEIGANKFHLILTSETIYNEANYKLLLDTMDALLASDGKIFLAAKNYYFGVGGSIEAFKEFVCTHGKFTVQEVWSTTTSAVPRKILELKMINQKI